MWRERLLIKLKRLGVKELKPFAGIASLRRSRALQYRDAKGVILLDILPQGQCINAARYCSTLDRLKEAIRRKRPGLLRRGVVFQHDNATPHSANLTQQWLQRYGWEILPHPAHSPDLAPSDFHLFGLLKCHLGGMAFETEDDLISELRNCRFSASSTYTSRSFTIHLNTQAACEQIVSFGIGKPKLPFNREGCLRWSKYCIVENFKEDMQAGFKEVPQELVLYTIMTCCQFIRFIKINY
ncbi:histone-lysine N-methyltransferase SETMAR [Plakobranchus ocellatus]|uniref:Histone-lysine N-methyltransferase SETMAR n=1 Tax=Plakobranchus ocellatus TaxID=259542 RepID=A0AAV3ZFW4_9GAST|nr:histone-lysine N-methyltransferase SETMAR [Plakobranchus ocellatus]